VFAQVFNEINHFASFASFDDSLSLVCPHLVPATDHAEWHWAILALLHQLVEESIICEVFGGEVVVNLKCQSKALS